MKRGMGTLAAAAMFCFTACDAGSNSNSPQNAAAGSGASITPPAFVAPASTASPESSASQPANVSSQKHFDDADVEAAVSVIREYYAAINARDYRNAYELWSGKGEASGQSFADFASGFTETASVEARVGKPGVVEGAAGSRYISIPVTLRAKMADGSTQEFAGEYVLRRSVVDGATAEQKTWRISSAKLKKK